MITKCQTLTLRHGTRLYFLDKTGTRVIECRISGKVKTWQRRPEAWRVPVKYGLYESFYIGTEFGCDDPARFYLDSDDLNDHLPPQVKGKIVTKARLASFEKLLCL